jgi:hypothetical protein
MTPSGPMNMAKWVSWEEGEGMAKSAEYLLVTATVGAVAMVVGSMSWTGVAKLIATFT